MTSFHTISHPTDGLYKEKGSKFIAHTFPVETEDEVKQHLTALRNSYHDARHYCYAYVIGLESQSFRANDDGEPSHSAGDPILGQIRSFGLTNVLVVVVRYFGGTKLGVGGLINAYKTASEQALAQAGKVQIFEELALELTFPYELMSSVERLITDLEIKVVNRDFQEDCRISGRIKKELVKLAEAKTKDLYNLQMSINRD